MKTYLLKPGVRKAIARAGETGVAVAYNASAWINDYPSGVPQLMVTRPNGQRMPVTVTVTDNLIAGQVPDELLVNPGMYSYVFAWTSGETQLTSGKCECIVLGSDLAKTWADIKRVPDWAERIFLAAGVIESSFDGAVAIRNEIMDALHGAEDAQTAAEAAQEAAEDAQEAAEGAQAAAEAVQASIPEDYSELSSDVVDLKSAIDDAKLCTYGSPSNINWTLGNVGSSGNFVSYKNTVRNITLIPIRKGSKLSCNSGYIMRIYYYNKNAAGDATTTAFIKRSDWGTSFIADDDYKFRVTISDTAHYSDTTYVLPDTSYSEQIIWTDFILSDIRTDVTVLQSDMQNAASEIIQKMVGGYVNISELLNNDGGILQGTVGDVISFYPQYVQAYKSIAFPVNIGEKVRVSGEASSNYRLWMFTDTDRKVLQKSSAFLIEQNLEITAQQDGYVVFNAIRTGAYTPKIEIWVSNLPKYIDANEKKTNYENISVNHGVLSAFSNIVCCGDSITTSVVYTGETWEGGQVTYQARAAYRRWTQILADRTGANVSYLATGGFTPKVWWETYASRIASADNQLAIIYLGTNGALTDTLDEDAQGMDASQYNANNNTGCYCKIVKAWLDVGARVLLIHVKKGDDLYTTNAVIDKIGDKFGVAVVEVPGLWDNKYHSYPDGSGSNSVHYNDLGYAAFAETLMAAVGALDETMFLRLCPR